MVLTDGDTEIQAKKWDATVDGMDVAAGDIISATISQDSYGYTVMSYRKAMNTPYSSVNVMYLLYFTCGLVIFHAFLSMMIRLLDNTNEIRFWTYVTDELPDPICINPHTKEYQEYMCLVQVNDVDEPESRPLSFSEDKKWMKGTVDVTAYVIAWQKLPNVAGPIKCCKKKQDT